MYQLYYYPNNASLAPHFLLHHMQLEYELVLVDTETQGHKTSEYLSLNPAGRIPTLVFDGQALFESPAICTFLCERHPEHGLMPALGDSNRPYFYQWLSFLNNTLQADLMVRYYAHRHTRDPQSIPAVQAAQGDRIADSLAILDARLSDRPFLLGDALSACDYFLFMLSEWALPVERSPLSFVHLAAYVQRMSQLPTVQVVCRLEKIDIRPFSTAVGEVPV